MQTNFNLENLVTALSIGPGGFFFFYPQKIKVTMVNEAVIIIKMVKAIRS